MLDRSPVRPRRALLGAGLLAAGLWAATAPAPVHAALSRCSSDPIVYLSTGVKVDLTATLGVDREDVLRISYALHVPAGATVTRVVYTSGALGHREHVTVSDDAVGPYVAETVASSKVAGTAVSVSMTVLDQTSGARAQDSASGQDGQVIATQAGPTLASSAD